VGEDIGWPVGLDKLTILDWNDHVSRGPLLYSRGTNDIDAIMELRCEEKRLPARDVSCFPRQPGEIALCIWPNWLRRPAEASPVSSAI
jgi:hypothetical protein